jgi:hypothetical protein
MQNPSPSKLFASAIFAACVAAVPARANLLLNGSFEAPVVPSFSLTCGPVFNTDCQGYYSPDQPGFPGGPSDIAGWSVIGKGGTPGVAVVLQLGNNYTEPNGTGGTLHFHAQNGNQSLDLTGEGNQGLTNGVKQSVTTGSGLDYRLSFYVGNQDNSAPGYPEPSSIVLYIDGAPIDTFTTPDSTANDVSWRHFHYDFTAAAALTTIAFLNGTGIGDNYAGLDHVVLSEVRAVAEPGTLGLIFSGVVTSFLLRRRKASR